jgi:hypothetical protein
MNFAFARTWFLRLKGLTGVGIGKIEQTCLSGESPTRASPPDQIAALQVRYLPIWLDTIP